MRNLLVVRWLVFYRKCNPYVLLRDLCVSAVNNPVNGGR
jgi:hypothetical protein